MFNTSWKTRRRGVLALALTCAVAASGQTARPKVAIKTFQNPANASRSTIGDGLTEILTTELQNTGKFNVLERGNVDELTKEMDFGDSEYAKGSTFAKKGNLLGAQYLLMGKVTNFSYRESAEQHQKINLLGPNTIETIYHQTADVRLDFRLIDVATGETVISQAGEAHETNVSRVSEIRLFYAFISGSASINVEGSSSMIGRATTAAVKDIVRKLNTLSGTVRDRGATASLDAALDNLGTAKGQLVAEEGGGLWIVSGIGSANGLQKGDHLRLTHENVVKDKSGKPVYRKAVDAGFMEVTDVSQSDHAEARVLANTAPVRNPEVSDLVTVDVEYARGLRGGSSGATASSSPPASAGVSTAGNAQLDSTLKRAQSYLDDKFWSQALDEFKKAAAMNSTDPRVLAGIAMSQYMMGDFIEGDETADKLLQVGGTLTVPVAHYHAQGVCTGSLLVQRGKLSYISTKDDSFETVTSTVAVRRIAPGFIANEHLPNWPVVSIEVRDSGSKEKKYQLLPYAYSKQPDSNGRNFGSAFPMDDTDIAQMQKFEQSLVALINKYAK